MSYQTPLYEDSSFHSASRQLHLLAFVGRRSSGGRGLHNRKELSKATPRGQSISLCGVLFLLSLHRGPLLLISIVYVLFILCTEEILNCILLEIICLFYGNFQCCSSC